MDLAEAYEISVSGGPLGRNSTLPSKQSVVGSSPTQGSSRCCPGWCYFVCDALACIP